MSELTRILDRVADELETSGLIKLAAELDKVSNSLAVKKADFQDTEDTWNGERLDDGGPEYDDEGPGPQNHEFEGWKSVKEEFGENPPYAQYTFETPASQAHLKDVMSHPDRIGQAIVAKLLQGHQRMAGGGIANLLHRLFNYGALTKLGADYETLMKKIAAEIAKSVSDSHLGLAYLYNQFLDSSDPHLFSYIWEHLTSKTPKIVEETLRDLHLGKIPEDHLITDVHPLVLKHIETIEKALLANPDFQGAVIDSFKHRHPQDAKEKVFLTPEANQAYMGLLNEYKGNHYGRRKFTQNERYSNGRTEPGDHHEPPFHKDIWSDLLY